MIPRRIREVYYQACGPLMWLNGLRHRYFPTHKFENAKVHFGPGQQCYLDGWINVDANTFTGKCDIWADLRNKLPFPDDTISAIYSHHFIEHLPNLRFHFAEMHRILKLGGVIRVGGPDGDMAIKKFIENDTGWFSDFPERRRSIGGRFENFIFCKTEHLTILTRSWLTELAEDAGFSDIHFVQPQKETFYSEIYDQSVLEMEHKQRANPECHITLMMEAKKN